MIVAGLSPPQFFDGLLFKVSNALFSTIAFPFALAGLLVNVTAGNERSN